jgi:Tripartite tricarboxylate transporter TctB family
MGIAIRHPKDFWAGLIFTASGLAFGILAQDYDMGTTTKMGPAYFPTVLAVLLTIIGLATTVRSFVIHGPPLQGFAVKAVLLVLGPIVLFGFVLRGVGLAAALLALALISAYASVRFRWQATVPLAIGLTVFSILVFVMGLGLPIRIVGRWLGG